MFSKSCQYAIKAMIFVGQKSSDANKVSVKVIAKGINAPEAFIAKILQDLSRKDLIQSMKGPNGGFYLENQNAETSIADIVKAIDGDKIYDNCILGLKACSQKNPCPVHHEYLEIKKNFLKMIENNTIKEFNEKLNSGKYFLKNN
jgi:Rrf2 family protein